MSRPAVEGSPLCLRLACRKRQHSDASADEPQPVSSKLKPSEAPTLDPPSFPTEVEEFVKISEHGGSTAYLSFAADYSTIRMAVVFASPKQKEISSNEEELKWVVEYGVVLRGARVNEASLQLLVESILKTTADSQIPAVESPKGNEGWNLLVSKFKGTVREPEKRWGAFEVGYKLNS